MDPGVLCLSAPRADRNLTANREGCTWAALPQRTACRSQLNDMLVITNGTVFVSAHRLQIATANVHKAPRADLWNAL